MRLYPPVVREIQRTTRQAASATNRRELAIHVKDASEQLRRELRRTEVELHEYMTKAVAVREELRDLLHQLNEVTKAKLAELKPEAPTTNLSGEDQ